MFQHEGSVMVLIQIYSLCVQRKRVERAEQPGANANDEEVVQSKHNLSRHVCYFCGVGKISLVSVVTQN